jgi:hypothetical protein
MQDGFHNHRQPASAGLNRVLTKQDKRRIREIVRARASEQGVNPKDALRVFSLCRTTLDIKMGNILLRKICDETAAKRLGPSYRRILVTDGVRRQRFERAI